MPAVVLPHAALPFPGTLPEFQRLFRDDTDCAAYLEAIRWRDGFVCGWCGELGEAYRFANRPHVLRCRKCQRDNALTAGTVMERTRTPLSIWFWAAYLVSELEGEGIGGEGAAGQPWPFDRLLALFDPLLCRAALVVEGDEALGWPRQVGDDKADARVELARMHSTPAF